jgi:hypothetical protein
MGLRILAQIEEDDFVKWLIQCASEGEIMTIMDGKTMIVFKAI